MRYADYAPPHPVKRHNIPSLDRHAIGGQCKPSLLDLQSDLPRKCIRTTLRLIAIHLDSRLDFDNCCFGSARRHRQTGCMVRFGIDKT